MYTATDDMHDYIHICVKRETKLAINGLGFDFHCWSFTEVLGKLISRCHSPSRSDGYLVEQSKFYWSDYICLVMCTASRQYNEI